jgi:spore coat polysaccharide biosynthesis protein SpsF
VENDKNISDLRWTVDEESDLRFVRQVYRRLYRDRKFFFMDDILNMLEKEPQLVQINKNIKQKDIK